MVDSVAATVNRFARKSTNAPRASAPPVLFGPGLRPFALPRSGGACRRFACHLAVPGPGAGRFRRGGKSIPCPRELRPPGSQCCCSGCQACSCCGWPSGSSSRRCAKSRRGPRDSSQWKDPSDQSQHPWGIKNLLIYHSSHLPLRLCARQSLYPGTFHNGCLTANPFILVKSFLAPKAQSFSESKNPDSFGKTVYR